MAIRFFIAVFLLFTSPSCTSETVAKKTDRAKQRVSLTSSENDRGPEWHRACITAYWVRKGDCVLDIGAHVGNFSLFYSKLVGEKGLVFAYEAMAENLKGVTNIIPKHRAVSDTTNQMIPMKIYPHSSSPLGCTVEPLLWNEERMPGDTAIVDVPTAKIDDLLEDPACPSVRFIKIDTEGHEHAVLRGAKQLLLKHRPLVIFEFGFAKGQFEPDTIRQMEELNYVCYDCNTDQRVHPGYGEDVPSLLTDLLAIPVEHEEEIVTALPYLH